MARRRPAYRFWLALAMLGPAGSAGLSCGPGMDSDIVRAERADKAPTVLPVPTVLRVPAVLPGRTQLPVPTPRAEVSDPAPTPRPAPTPSPAPAAPLSVMTGAAVLAESGFGQLAGKRVGLIVNQTSVVGPDHLVDLTDAHPDVELAAIFAPEHGFRGLADAGEAVASGQDPDTGIIIHSLYGATRAPTPDMLADIDVLVYDIQDVGARYYTYISTMGLAMAAAADAGIEFVVLDRPNPQIGGHVSGNVAGPEQRSFVSQYPIPATYAMTAGELAQAIVGERWLPGLDGLDLTVIAVTGWHRNQPAHDPASWIPPSPGLPTLDSALLYPATVLFEATTLSYGKGTPFPFAVVGAPWLDGPLLATRLNSSGFAGVRVEPIDLTPTADIAPNPRWEGTELGGVRIAVSDPSRFVATEFGVHLLVEVRDLAAAGGIGPIIDRPEMFDLLAGSADLRVGLEQGRSAPELIRQWRSEVGAFAAIRGRYLLYSDPGP